MFTKHEGFDLMWGVLRLLSDFSLHIIVQQIIHVPASAEREWELGLNIVILLQPVHEHTNWTPVQKVAIRIHDEEGMFSTP